jgi:hypothetical protein
MTTSQPNAFLSEILSGQPIPAGKLAYFRGRLSHRIHELVLDEFARLEEEGKITRAGLARRINRKPEQITRWLGMAGNLETDTVSDLLLGMGCELGVSLINLTAAAPQAAPAWPELPSEQEASHRLAGNDETYGDQRRGVGFTKTQSEQTRTVHLGKRAAL